MTRISDLEPTRPSRRGDKSWSSGIQRRDVNRSGCLCSPQQAIIGFVSPRACSSRKALFGSAGGGGQGLLRSTTGFGEMVARPLRVRFRHELPVLGSPIEAALFVINLGILICPD